MIDFYTAPTPNGFKIAIALEELGLPYTVKVVDLSQNEQKQPAFLKLNPNGRIPVIVDQENDHFVVFESGAILIYLAERCGQLLPSDPKGRSVALQWLMFQMSGVGPMMGQANVFYRYFPETIPAAIARYQHESKRLLTVLDQRLADHEYLAGELSIADIATWPWARGYGWAGLDIDDLPHLQRWLDQLAQRPAFAKGITIPPQEADPEEQVKAVRTFLGQ